MCLCKILMMFVTFDMSFIKKWIKIIIIIIIIIITIIIKNMPTLKKKKELSLSRTHFKGGTGKENCCWYLSRAKHRLAYLHTHTYILYLMWKYT